MRDHPEHPVFGAEGGDLRNSLAVLAPHGRDAVVAETLLAKEGYEATLVTNLCDLAEVLRQHVGAVLVTEEALSGSGINLVEDALGNQPAWSDVPFIVLTNGTASARSALARGRLDMLRNAVLLSRPLHAEELLRAVRSALTARARQHEARARLEELEQRETELRESEAKFHAIANSVDQMIWSTRPDGYHDYYNDRWYEFTGMPIGSTDGEEWNGMFHPDDQEKAWSVWRASLASGEPYEIEYRLRHHSGEYFWVLGRAKAVRDPSGRILRWYGSCTDIHDEVMAREAAVDELTRQRDRAWSLSNDLLSVGTMEGELLALNNAWESLLGYKTSQLIGTNALALAHPDDLEQTVAVLRTLHDEPLVTPYEYRMRHADGSYRWFAWTASTEDNKFYAAGRDVTERRAKDSALASAEAALRQSQKLDMIGQLTGGVAHDFNNLLMAIRSSLDLLRRRVPPGDDNAARYIENATKAADRGAGLTQRMLAFARKQDLHPHAVDVGSLVPDMRDLLSRSLGPQIEIVTKVSVNLPYAVIDTNQLEMAILNLAVNGRDAMEGGGQLTLALDCVDVDASSDLVAGRYVRISVSDTGLGMDEATLNQAMEPFFTTKGVGKGTGLGLSMVHGLAKQSGGTFRITSTPGQGTTATIFLPIATETDMARPKDLQTAAGEGPPAKARLTILAVDDDVLVSMGTVGLLEDLGHEVIEVHSGAAALAVMTERHDIDLMITDQAMPKMTGVELARQVREMRPGLPIILATGYAEMPEGGADYITLRLEKPFSDAALGRALSELT